MKILQIGCGRWGSFLAWYLDKIGHELTIYGRASSENMKRLVSERKNDFLTLPESIKFSYELSSVNEADTIVISVGSQSLRLLLTELKNTCPRVTEKNIVLCMKGIEISSGMRLSEIAEEILGHDSRVAVWLGPGHVQEFFAGVPNCMVIDSKSEELKHLLVDSFSSALIRLYYGDDLIGNEIGAATKNVIGIAAGMLDGKGLSSLKGALMARGAREVARLIRAMGGCEHSAYGLCHLGDYEATVFSRFSHNRAFGEAYVLGEKSSGLAEGYYTVCAIMKLSERYSVDMPICSAVYSILYEGKDCSRALDELFERRLKKEFY